VASYRPSGEVRLTTQTMSVDDFLIVTPYCFTSGGSWAWAVWTLFWMSTAARSCEKPTSNVATMLDTPLLVLSEL